MSSDSREKILAAARQAAQAHGYGGLNFRDLAADVGIKAASIYHHFPSKADLGAAVARRYWEDTAAGLEAMSAETRTRSAACANIPRPSASRSRTRIACASAASWPPNTTTCRNR